LHSEIKKYTPKMKNVILSFLLLTALSVASCKKDSKEGASPAAASTIHMEYRISSESGKVNISYLYPGADGKLTEKTEELSRSSYCINFNYSSGNLFRVEASNIEPSHKTVQVEIYVNGVLRSQGISTSPSQKAIAQGNF
jgi:hypothetical protein